MSRMFWKPVDRKKIIDLIDGYYPGHAPGLERELAKADAFLKQHPSGKVEYFLGLKNNSAIAVCRKKE